MRRSARMLSWEKLGSLRMWPLHDWASHAADAFRTAAVMIREPDRKKEQERRRLGGHRKTRPRANVHRIEKQLISLFRFHRLRSPPPNAIAAVTMAVAVPVIVTVVSLIAAVSVVALIVITSVPLVMRHGDGHGLHRDISGSVRTLNSDRVNPAGAVSRPLGSQFDCQVSRDDGIVRIDRFVAGHGNDLADNGAAIPGCFGGYFNGDQLVIGGPEDVRLGGEGFDRLRANDVGDLRYEGIVDSMVTRLKRSHRRREVGRKRVARQVGIVDSVYGDALAKVIAIATEIARVDRRCGAEGT